MTKLAEKKDISELTQEAHKEFFETYLFSEIYGGQRKYARDYLVDKLANPDEGSDFERQLGLLKYVFKVPVINSNVAEIGIRQMQKKGYDVLLMDYQDTDENIIAGHSAFQIHPDNSMHVFSLEVNPDYRRMGLGKHMLEDILDKAREKEIEHVRIGTGKVDAIAKVHRDFASREDELGVYAEGNGWFRLRYDS